MSVTALDRVKSYFCVLIYGHTHCPAAIRGINLILLTNHTKEQKGMKTGTLPSEADPYLQEIIKVVASSSIPL